MGVEGVTVGWLFSNTYRHKIQLGIVFRWLDIETEETLRVLPFIISLLVKRLVLLLKFLWSDVVRLRECCWCYYSQFR